MFPYIVSKDCFNNIFRSKEICSAVNITCYITPFIHSSQIIQRLDILIFLNIFVVRLFNENNYFKHVSMSLGLMNMFLENYLELVVRVITMKYF